ncbi:alpha/beta fold hydrolase [Thalassotalea atypica]|uniref:alpha/beta fold hydrolase n=1 Tax=Thalassotalea atypica TaxID=2054316 RepID=UPI00257309E0|nr:alpha/beta hydrolase [Thalassotalea atypica]
MKQVLRISGGLFLLLVVVFGAFIALNWQADTSVEQLKTKWATPPSQFADIEGMQLHFRDEGLRDDPTPIILIHGTSASLHTWDDWVEILKTEHRVIRFDLPAFGLTGPDPDNDYTIENYADTVIALLDHLQVKESILVGNSLGGYVAWATTIIYPDRVKQLTLIDASGYPFESQSVPIAFKIANTPVLNKIMNKVLPRSVVRSSLENVYGDPSQVTDGLVNRYFELTTRKGNRQALTERFRQTRPGPIADKMSEIKQPTLIMWGGQDRLIPTENGERFNREIQNSQLVRFDELGHVPHEEAPMKTVAAFKAFIAEQHTR